MKSKFTLEIEEYGDVDHEIKGIFSGILYNNSNTDSVSIKDDIFFLKVDAAPFTIKGKIDRETETIKCEFVQGDNQIPLVLKRVEELPESN